MLIFPRNSYFDKDGNHWLKTGKPQVVVVQEMEEKLEKLGRKYKKTSHRDGTVTFTIYKENIWHIEKNTKKIVKDY